MTEKNEKINIENSEEESEKDKLIKKPVSDNANRNNKGKSQIKGLLTILIVIILIIGVGGLGYYVFVTKPLKEAKNACETALNNYENIYSRYAESIDEYNKKVQTVSVKYDELDEATADLEKLANSVDNDSLKNEANKLVIKAKKVLAARPEKSQGEEKKVFATDNLSREEYAKLTGTIQVEATDIDGNNKAINERINNLEDPDFSDILSDINDMKEKIRSYKPPKKETFGFYDPFDNLEVIYTGIDPKGKITLKKKNNNGMNSEYEFKADKTTNLENGDTINISVVPIKKMGGKKDIDTLNDDLEKKYNKRLSPLSEEMTVSGLEKYIEAASEISPESFGKMKSAVEADYRNTVNKTWKNQVNINSLEYIGNCLLMRKPLDRGLFDDSKNNYFYLIYKVNATIDLTEKGKNYTKDVDYYYVAYYDNVTILGDGTCALNYKNISRVNDSFTIKTNVNSGWFTKYEYTFHGYEDLDQLRYAVVIKNKDKYDYEENY